MNTTDRLAQAMAEPKPALIVFVSPEHPHSMEMRPILEQLEEQMGDAANIVEVNGREFPDLVKKFKVHSYPTEFVYKDGSEFWHDSGVKPVAELADMLNRVR